MADLLNHGLATVHCHLPPDKRWLQLLLSPAGATPAVHTQSSGTHHSVVIVAGSLVLRQSLL